MPKFLGYFERVLQKNGGKYLVGGRLSYVDLSLFQIVAGLRYAFPKRMKRFEKKIPGLVALHDRVAQRPRIKAYLASERRIDFSQWGIYRYFKELDAEPGSATDCHLALLAPRRRLQIRGNWAGTLQSASLNIRDASALLFRASRNSPP